VLKRELQLHGLCEEIGLERLAVGDVARYVTRKFGDGLTTDLADFVHLHSGGNPLFMVAIVQDLRDKSWITRENGLWKLTVSLETIDPGIPETLQQMFDIQFDQLSASEQQILRSASVAGERFSVWLISPSLEFASDQIEDLCEGLAERQQLIRAAGIDEVANGTFTACYEFIHALYREGIYRRLSDLARSRLHRKIAERLESGNLSDNAQELAAELARHFECGHDYARAIRYLLKAAERAGCRFAYRESIRILQHALELVPRVPSGAELECQIHEFIGDACYALGAMAESAKSYQTGASRAARAGLKTAQVSALSSLVRPLGLIDPDRGIAAIDEAARLTDGLDDPLLAARTRMLGAAIRLLYDTWRNEDAELCATAYETIRRLGEDETPSYHKMIYAHVRVLQGDYEEAIAMFDHDAFRLEGPTSLMAHFFALSGKMVALLRSGRLGEVQQIVRDGKEMAAKNGNDPWLFNFREAWLHVLTLDFEGARRLCEAMLCSSPEYPTGQPQAIARVSEGYAELERGNYDRAVECFSQVADSRSDGKFFLHWAWRMTAQLGLSDTWLAAEDLGNARNTCDLFRGSALSTSDPYFRALAWDRMARLAMLSKDSDAAQGYVDQALSVVKDFVVPMAAWQVNATAHDWNLQAKRDRAAAAHRTAAVRHILSIANSFAADEPLRASFLAAAPVQRILTGLRSAE
jgi:tetratricopeptide (TPR) repeat protein